MKKHLFRFLIFTMIFLSMSSTTLLEPARTLSASNSPIVEKQQEELPLGKPRLTETRSSQQIAPGVRYTSINRGIRSTNDYYTIDAGFFTDKKEADDLQKKLTSQGFDSITIQVNNHPYNDIKKEIIGYLVRTGKFTTQDEANIYRKEIINKGFSNLKVVYSGYDGTDTTGPWSIHVLEIDRNLINKMSTSLAMDQIIGKETVSSMSQRTNSLVSINGSYFIVNDKDGTPGDIAGISVLRGELISEAINNRSGFILSGNKAAISTLSTPLSVQSSDGAFRELDGLNRSIGLIRNCGKLGSDIRISLPMHDITCTDDSELIQYENIYGKITPTGEGTEVILDENGQVIELNNARGHVIPEKGTVIAGSGEAGDWLKEHASVGMKLKVRKEILSNHKTISLNSQTNIVGGGPLLLKNNQYSIQADQEGFNYNDDFYYRFGINRHPRTLVGIKPNGNLLFVVADGRNPTISVGLSFFESAKLMKTLGAKDAMNLDGGGSTTMVIKGEIVNHPSDADGERPVADAISLLP